MWFKQLQIFKLATPIAFDKEALTTQLNSLAFTPCLPSLPFSYGWAPLFEEIPDSFVHAVNGYLFFCLQLEEKILPTTVVRQKVQEKVKTLEAQRERKVSQKEKFALKEDMTQILLPQAFSKISRIYAYIDTKNQWLILDTVSAARAEKFIELLKRTLGIADLHPLLTTKLTTTLTHWLIHQSYPQNLAVEKSCVLSDPNNRLRVIRCQQQDLSANGIQWIIKDGCEVKQLGLSWQDHLHFVLADDFTLRGLKFQDQVIAQAKELEPESKAQQFAADVFIMTQVLSSLLQELVRLFNTTSSEIPLVA